MASVNFMKCKGSTGLQLMRHCDTGKRLVTEHSNPDINKTRTLDNVILGVDGKSDTLDTFEAAAQKYQSRIEQLDATTNHNHRKDRVPLFALEMPAPEGLNESQAVEWCKHAWGKLQEQYRPINCIVGYVHVDEVHEYVDHGKIRTSRIHLHAFVVPEVRGQLNGKKFSSQTAMQALNREIDTMTIETYGKPFLTGEKARKRSVEALKEESVESVRRAAKELVREREAVLRLLETIGKAAGHYDLTHTRSLEDRLQAAASVDSDLQALLRRIQQSEEYKIVMQHKLMQRQKQQNRDQER